jgi:hypothetical protein
MTAYPTLTPWLIQSLPRERWWIDPLVELRKTWRKFLVDERNCEEDQNDRQPTTALVHRSKIFARLSAAFDNLTSRAASAGIK